MRLISNSVWSASLALIVLGATLALAQDKTERVQRFEQASEQIKSLYRVHVPNKDFAAIARDAQAIADWGKEMVEYFPPGSDARDDRAKPNIWEEFGLFTVLAKDMEQAASDLVVLARNKNGADLQDALNHLGKRCSTCHQRFRTKD